MAGHNESDAGVLTLLMVVMMMGGAAGGAAGGAVGWPFGERCRCAACHQVRSVGCMACI